MYLGYPVSKLKRQLFHIFIGLFFFVSLLLFEDCFRSEDDFLNQREYCGEILDYSFSSNRGALTWRLAISPAEFDKKVFKVGGDYIQSIIQKDDMVKGRNICVSYIPMTLNIENPFITQITLDGDDILDYSDVLFEYLRPNVSLYIYIQIILLILLFISLIRAEKRG